MDLEFELKLQAYLDGELPEAEGREVADRLRTDAGAEALFSELRNTRSALAAFDAEAKLPESREFYWSKIQRDIKRLEEARPSGPTLRLWSAWRRILIPASATLAMVFVVFVVSLQVGFWARPAAAQLQTNMSDPGAFTYRDDSAGMTLVWLPYAGENEIAERAPAGTLQ